MYPSEQDQGGNAGATAALGTIVAAILIASCGAKKAPSAQTQTATEKKPTPIVQTTNQPPVQRYIYTTLRESR